MTDAQRNAEIAKMATEFMQFLDNNCGYGADWPVSLSASDDAMDELIEHMNALRSACGIKEPDHRALYRRPPELKR